MKIKKIQQRYFSAIGVLSIFLLSGLFFSVALAADPNFPNATLDTTGSATNFPTATLDTTGSATNFPNATLDTTGSATNFPTATPDNTSSNPSSNSNVGTGVVIPTNTGLASGSIKDILTNFLNWLLMIVGIVALIGFIISGLQYILAAGDDKLMEVGKKNMMYSIMGIVVVLASLVVVQAIDLALRAQTLF